MGVASTDTEKTDKLSKFSTSVYIDEPTETLQKVLHHKVSPLKLAKNMIEIKLATLKPEKLPILDKIHPRLLKELSFEVGEPLKVIFETLLRQSKLPSIWKLGSITPIFKKEKNTQEIIDR